LRPLSAGGTGHIAMVRHKEVEQLYVLCHREFAQYLGDRLIKSSYNERKGFNATLSTVRQKLRPYFLEHIPTAVRSSLIEATSEFLFNARTQEYSAVDCLDYGRSLLYLLHLLMSKEIQRLSVTLCCYYGCRDLDGVLRCIKKNGESLQHLELSRSSLLRMDPFLFRNVLSSATHLSTLIVKNICSDAMLRLMGTHCHNLQHLDISNSKQVSDQGIEYLLSEFHIRERPEVLSRSSSHDSSVHKINHKTGVQLYNEQVSNTVNVRPIQSRITVREDYGNLSQPQRVSKMWKSIKKRFGACLSMPGRTSCVASNYSDFELPDNDVLVEVTQVMQPVCSTLTTLDITGTSVTSHGLQCLLRKLSQVGSLGEYTISDSFLRSLCVVSSLNMDKFTLRNLHARKISDAGMYNMVHVFPYVEHFTCWEPAFDLSDLIYFCHLKQLTLLRVVFTETVFQQLLKFFRTSQTYYLHAVQGLTTTASNNSKKIAQPCKLQKLVLELVLQDDFSTLVPLVEIPLEFDIGRVLQYFESIKILSVDFKDTVIPSPPVTYSSVVNKANLKHLVYVQLGQIVHNSAVEAVLKHCPALKHLHCNTCPNLTDLDLASAIGAPSPYVRPEPLLECFYIYEAPGLTVNAFELLVDGFPRLQKNWKYYQVGYQL